MRICMLDGAVSYGGSLVVVSELAREFVKAGHQVMVCTSLGSERDIDRLFDRGSMEICRYSPRLTYVDRLNWLAPLERKPRLVRSLAAYCFEVAGWFANAPAQFHLLAAMWRFSPDVIHANGAMSAGWLAILLRKPLVVHCHAICRIRRLCRLARRCTYVGVSEHVRREAIAISQVKHVDVVSIPNQVRPEALEPARVESLRRSIGGEDGALLVGHVGRLVEWKGQLEFLRAFAIVAKAVPQARAVIVGSDEEGFKGNYRHVLEQFVDEHGLGDKVFFLGWVDETRAVMAACDLVVHSSIEAEPFGLVITEAMSVGRPVVVSDLGAPPEIVREGIDGYVVSPLDSAALADRMRRLLLDPGLRARMGSNGKARVLETYDPAVIAGRFVSLYDAMLKGERG